MLNPGLSSRYEPVVSLIRSFFSYYWAATVLVVFMKVSLVGFILIFAIFLETSTNGCLGKVVGFSIVLWTRLLWEGRSGVLSVTWVVTMLECFLKFYLERDSLIADLLMGCRFLLTGSNNF
jgi:hypothetical protein